MSIKNKLMSLAVGSMVMLGTSTAFAEGFVKVECNGNCSNITLGQVCDKYRASSVPVAISCDDTATPGNGSSSACGTGLGRCTPWGTAFRSDPVSAYCADGTGNDVVVTCK